jgi:hypothetical protein
MISKRTLVLVSIASLVTLTIVLPHVSVAGNGQRPRYRMEGTWLLRNDDGAVSVATFVPAGPDNDLVSLAVDVVNFDSTLGGIFPDVSLSQNMSVRGDMVRTGPGTFAYSWVVYGRSETREILWIMTTAGIAEFLGPDTYDDNLTIRVYSAREQESPVLGVLPDQDVDGNGFPDADQEPLVSIPMHNVARRLLSLGG